MKEGASSVAKRMGRLLKSGVPKVMADHRTAEGCRLKALYLSLVQQFGPFTPFLAYEAAGVAMTALQYEKATQELTKLQVSRRRGRGRRPSLRDVERAARRQALNYGTYAAAVRRLEELTHRNGRMKAASGRDLLTELLPEGEEL